MLTSQYIRKKNAIALKLTGVTIVPEGQIRNVEPRQLTTDNIANMCPYCALYFDNECVECPMKEAGNRCDLDVTNTWDIFSDKAIHIPNLTEVPEFIALIKEYNKSNNF